MAGPAWRTMRQSRMVEAACWIGLCVWAGLQLAIVAVLHTQQQRPIDFWSYQIAADKIQRGASPYAPAAESLVIWRSYHAFAERVLDRGGDNWRGTPDAPAVPGPYVYPPTLALLIAQTGIGAVPFTLAIVLSVVGFCWLWLGSTRVQAVWLLLVILSWDIFASASGGNVELVLLFLTLAAARLLFIGRWLAAAPLLTFVVFVKPFFVLFFVAFGALLLASRPDAQRKDWLRAVLLVGAATCVLAGVEIYRWGPFLRAEALDFAVRSWEHQWFVLPVIEQTPMSIWNRTPLQGLVNAGVPLTIAQWVALSLWFVFLGVTIWQVRGSAVGFHSLFALAFLLLYWGRPVNWTLNYLEFVVVLAVWPFLGRAGRSVVLGAAAALMLSHWAALLLTVSGHTVSLFTLQSAEFPWETWLVFPAAWIVLLYGVSSQMELVTLERHASAANG